MKKTFEEKPGNSFKRFEEFVKKIINVPKREIDEREAEYQRKKVLRRNGRLLEHATTDLDTKSGAEFPPLLVSTIMFGGCAAWLRVIKVN